MLLERPLLRFDAVTKRYDGGGLLVQKRRSPPAVDAVTFDIARGETFGLVGESGSGKSTLARLATGLLRPGEGAVWFDGINLGSLLRRRDSLPVRRRIQMIFQDPGSSLDPRWTVRDIVAEPIRTHGLRPEGAALQHRVDEVLCFVGLTSRDGYRHPHEFSGGQRQRISIARALAAEAEFIVCDEPTSALDVSIQAQILNILVDLQRSLGLTYLFISHNLPVIAFMSHRIGVMYQGRLVEYGDARDVLGHPAHPYTRALVSTAQDPGQVLPSIGADADTVAQGWSAGCAFRGRCGAALPICARTSPLDIRNGNSLVACHAVGSPAEGVVAA